MNNIVPLPILELHKLIETANQTRKLQPLLEAIRLACPEKTNFAPIIQAWAAGKNHFEPVSFDELKFKGARVNYFIKGPTQITLAPLNPYT